MALTDVANSVGTIKAGQVFKATDGEAAKLVAAGKAEYSNGAPKPWTGLQWPGAQVMILASGPSLSEAQCELARVWRHASSETARRVIAVNTTFRRAPWADVLYACDAPWWRVYHQEVATTFKGQRWTQDPAAARLFPLELIPSVRGKGLGKRPGLIHQGGNGGYQAINLAYQAGAKKMVLLGFDMQGSHWHGKYTNGLPNTAPHLFEEWIKSFDALAADLEEEGVEVMNCSPSSRLTCFPLGELQKVNP